MSIYKCDECGCKRDTNEDGYHEYEDGLILCDICESMLHKDLLMESITKLLGMDKNGEVECFCDGKSSFLRVSKK